MKYCGTLIAVRDMERSKEFYKSILGLDVADDFGANVALTGGVFLQTVETWRDFIDKKDVGFYNHAVELYFEEDDFDKFSEKIKDVELIHPTKEHGWGQRAVRFYDPDGHVIEVGEKIEAVIQRFIDSGMTIAKVAERMDVTVEYVKKMIEG